MIEQKPLESLEREQIKHSRAIERRQGLLVEIEKRKLDSGFAEVNNWISSLRTLNLQERVETIVILRGERLAHLERRIEEFSGPLITRAEEYKVKKFKQEMDLAEFERFYKAGRLGNRADEILARRRAAFADLRSQAEADPELKRGLELLKRREQPQQAAVTEVTPVKEDEESDSVPDIKETVVDTPAQSEVTPSERLQRFKTDTEGLSLGRRVEVRIQEILQKSLSEAREIPATEIIEGIYSDDIDKKIKLGRLSGEVSLLRKKYQGRGWGIPNVAEVRGMEYVLKPLNEVEDNITLPNGEKLEDLSLSHFRILQRLLSTSSERPVFSTDLAKHVYIKSLKEGKITTVPVRIITGAFYAIRNILPEGYEIINLRPRGVEGLYYLKSPAATVPVEPEQIDSPEMPKPVLEVNLKTREVIMKAGDALQIIRMPLDIEWDILRFFLNHRGEKFTPYSDELTAIPERYAITHPHFKVQRVEMALGNLMDNFNIEGLAPVILEEKEGQVSTYQFDCEDILYLDSIRQAQLDFNVELPEGTLIRTQGSWETMALRRLVENFGSRINLGGLSTELFNSGFVHGRTLGILKKLNKLLESSTQEIVWEGVDVWLQEKATPPTPPLAPDRSATLVTTDEWIDIPYEPTKEEERSEEETRVLGRTVALMLADPFHKIRFENLQRELYTSKRSRRISGELFCQIYLAGDFRLFFSSAFSKIREEALVDFLRSKWTEEDSNLFESIQLLKQKMRITDDVELTRRVNEEFHRAQRQYYRDNPPAQEVPLGWIKVPDEWRSRQ